jgi:transcriptional regulator with XRE-family HTH domain
VENLSLQRKIFDLILEKFPKKSAAVSYLAGLLSLGNNAIYRRLRGDTLLTLSELYRLAQHFNISLDNVFFDKTDKIIFSNGFFTRQVSSFENYIDQVFESAQQLRKMPNAKIFYTSQEIPFFLYFASPALFAFKMYIYAFTYWNFEHLQDQKFSIRLIPDALFYRARKISDIYNMIPSTELWNANLIDHTLNQIEYLATIDMFEKPGDALLVCDSVHNQINHAREMAEKGYKYTQNDSNNKPGQQLTLYFNSFSRTNDTILITSDIGKIVYTSFGTPNYLTTVDETICSQIEEWFNSIIRRSTSITFHSGKERNKFFNDLEKRIGQTRKKIQVLIEE